MPPSIAPLLTWVREHASPLMAALLLAGVGGWYLHAASTAPTDLAATVSRLDASTVKRDTFALFVQDVNNQLRELRTDASLMRRFVCRRSPDLCP